MTIHPWRRYVVPRTVCLIFGVMAVVSPRLAKAGNPLFEDGFDGGSACTWSAMSPAGGCPPRFAGITLAAATGREQITLGWLPAVDDVTPPEDVLYRIFLGDCSGPGSEIGTVDGGTGIVIDGLEADTTYCARVVAEDQDGQGSSGPSNGSQWGLPIKTLTLDQVASAVPLETAESLYLGPATATPTSLTFQRGPNAVEPTVGAVLMGELDGEGGYIRQVESVSSTPDEIVVQTSAASIELAMDQFELSTSSWVSPIDENQEAAQEALRIALGTTPGLPRPRPIVETTTERFSGQVGGFEVIPLKDPRSYRLVSIDPANADEAIEIGEELTLDLNLDFTPEFRTNALWSPGGVKEAEVIGIGTLTLSALAEYHFEAAATYEPDPFTLFSSSWRSVYVVGSVPVYQKITFSLEAVVTASASAEITASAEATATATLEVGVRYDENTGWNTVLDQSFGTDLIADLSVVGGVQAEVRLVPKVTVEFYEAVAAWISVEPSVSTELMAEGTTVAPCLPLELTQFDADLEVEAKVGVDFTLIGDYSLFEATVWDPEPWVLFSLPGASISSTGTAPVNLQADITDGVNNPFDLGSAQWWTGDSGVVLTADPSDPRIATLSCTENGAYNVVFSGHGVLGPIARRCTERTVVCTTGAGGGDITINLADGLTMDLVYIPPGTFMMGSPPDELGRDSDEELHQVTLTQGYYLGTTEVTQAQWEAVTGSPIPTGGICGTSSYGPDYPAHCVSWDQIAGPGGFMDLLNQHLADTGQPGAGLMRLPTEAEWERAARAGTETRFSHGDVLECNDFNCSECTAHDLFMWWCGNANTSQQVGERQPNAFGLYDMHGNLWEWVQDWAGLYGPDPQVDPIGPGTGLHKSTRGGAHYVYPRYARSASRSSQSPQATGDYSVGFRIARTE